MEMNNTLTNAIGFGPNSHKMRPENILERIFLLSSTLRIYELNIDMLP